MVALTPYSYCRFSHYVGFLLYILVQPVIQLSKGHQLSIMLRPFCGNETYGNLRGAVKIMETTITLEIILFSRYKLRIILIYKDTLVFV